MVAAARTRNRRAAADDHVSKLARRTALTAIHLPIENDSRAHAFCYKNEYEIARVENFGSTKPQFSECNRVCVVVDHDRQADGVRDHFGYRKIAPEKVRDVERRAG